MPQGLAVYHNGVFQKRLQSVVRAMTGRFAQTCLFVETDGTVMKCSGEDTKQRGMFSLDLLETPYSILAGMPCTFCGFEQKERMNFAPAPTMMTTHFYVGDVRVKKKLTEGVRVCLGRRMLWKSITNAKSALREALFAFESQSCGIINLYIGEWFAWQGTWPCLQIPSTEKECVKMKIKQTEVRGSCQ